MLPNLSKENKVQKSEAIEAIKVILRYIGENPNDERLVRTPERVIQAYDKLFEGYSQNPEDVIKGEVEMKAFSSYPIIIKDIEFHSICEHHMLPFSGNVTVIYEPNEKIIGIGKIRKIVEIFSKRLQIQERITSQICETIYNSDLHPLGVAVFVNAKHSCSYVKDYLPNMSSLTTMHFCGCLRNQESRESLMRMI